MDSNKNLRIFAWGSSIIATGLAIAVWGQSHAWHIAGLNTYQVFPVLGLVAFSLMWSHYVSAALRKHLGAGREVLAKYFEATSAVVLALILLHPGLLTWRLWRDGLGLPPASVKAYVGTAAYWAVFLAAMALFVFLVYELRRWYHSRSWWKYVGYASDAAMLGIFIHALRLGSQLQSGWYRWVWAFYGVSLVFSIFYIHTKSEDPAKLT